MVFKVTPTKLSIINDINIDKGMAIPTNSAFLIPKKNSNTTTTNRIPKMILFSKSDTIVLVSFVWSLVLEIFRFEGKYCSLALLIILSICVEAFIKFSPPRLVTSSITTG